MARIQKFVKFALMVLIFNAPGSICSENEDNILSWKGKTALVNSSYRIPAVDASCVEYGICEDVKNYPIELASWVVKQMNNTQSIITSIDKMDPFPNDDSPSIYKLCSSEIRIYYPKAALSSNTEEGWFYILNLPKQNNQGFYVEKCNNKSSSPCLNFLSQQKTKCLQEFTNREMIYLDIEGEFVGKKSFKVPTCCSCAYM